MKSICFACLLILLGSLGCNSAEAPAEVSGTVMMDGVLLAEGEIIFEASDNSKTPAAGTIKDGKYLVKVLPGSKKVKVSSSRPASKPDPVMGSAAREHRIGPEFNEKTTLTADIKSGKNEGIDFQVKELAKKK